MPKLLSELFFACLLALGMVVVPFAPVLIGYAQSVEPSSDKEIADILDRWLGRAAEYGIIGIVALWLLRVIIVDVKGDIKLVAQLLMRISDQAKEGGDEVKRLSNEINTKIDRLLRDVERIEYKRQRGEDDK